MKSEVKYILISAGVVLAGIAVTASGAYSANKERDKFLEMPVLSGQEELETALAGEKQVYCLTDMEVSGTAAEDPMGILEGEYVYLYYAKYVCSEETGKTGETTYTWEYSSDDEIPVSFSEDLMLFEEYPVAIVEYTAVGDAETGVMALTADMVKPEYLDQVDEYYYPEEVGEFDGNVRYAVTAVPNGQKVAMYATVGDGEIQMEYNDDMASYVINNGTLDNLATYFSGDAGMMRTLIGIMIIIPLGILLMMITIIFGITSVIMKKKKPQTKTSQKSLAERSQMTKKLDQKNQASKKQ